MGTVFRGGQLLGALVGVTFKVVDCIQGFNVIQVWASIMVAWVRGPVRLTSGPCALVCRFHSTGVIWCSTSVCSTLPCFCKPGFTRTLFVPSCVCTAFTACISLCCLCCLYCSNRTAVGGAVPAGGGHHGQPARTRLPRAGTGAARQRAVRFLVRVCSAAPVSCSRAAHGPEPTARSSIQYLIMVTTWWNTHSTSLSGDICGCGCAFAVHSDFTHTSHFFTPFPQAEEAAVPLLPALLCTLGTVTVPSAASVYNEFALKKHMDTSVHLQVCAFHFCVFFLCDFVRVVLVMCELQRAGAVSSKQ